MFLSSYEQLTRRMRHWGRIWHHPPSKVSYPNPLFLPSVEVHKWKCGEIRNILAACSDSLCTDFMVPRIPVGKGSFDSLGTRKICKFFCCFQMFTNFRGLSESILGRKMFFSISRSKSVIANTKSYYILFNFTFS